MNEGTTATLASPALDHIIERPRLISLLEDSEAPLALLVAPAGYGKTTLARQWASRQSGPVAWHHTTRASGDVAALAVSLDNALATATEPPLRDPKRIGAIAAVNARPAPLARALVSTYAHLSRDVLLVVDEWEAAGTDEADELMAALVAELAIRVLVTSRTRPPWFTSRLEVYGEGLEVGLEELAMTDAEGIAVLLTNRHATNRKEVLAQARGWPAVLGLAAMSMRTEIPSQALSRTLHDFLTEELLAATPEHVTTAVLLLVVAGISEPSTARLVLGEDADALIAAAVSRGLVRVDDGAIGVHPLVREVLGMRLHDERHVAGSEVVARLRPLIAERKWDEALVAAETLQHRQFVEDALRTGLDELLHYHGTNTLDRWATIARATGVDRPLVAYVESESALRHAEWDKALALAANAAPQLSGNLAAQAHLVAAMAGHLGDRDAEVDPHISASLKLAESPRSRRGAHWLRFLWLVDEEDDSAADALQTFEMAADYDAETTVRMAHGRLQLGLLTGDLLRQLEDAEAALHLLDDEVTPLIQASFLNLYSNALATAARYRDALTFASREVLLADEYEFEFVKYPALVNRSKSLIGLRRIAMAQRALATLGRAAGSNPYLSTLHNIQTAALYLSTADPERACAALLVDPGKTTANLRAEYFATRGLALASLGNDRATESVRQAHAISRATEVHAVTSITRAVVALSHCDHDGATMWIRDAVNTGALHALVLGLRACSQVGECAAADQRLRPILIRLLLETSDTALARRLGLRVPRSRVRSQMLSPRELEIHGLIAQGMTNPEISRLLFISESTTKVHVRHIFEKLGVRSRAEAASVWQEPEP